jgi:hypothetical protein
MSPTGALTSNEALPAPARTAPAEPDSMWAECPWDVRYADVSADAQTLSEQQERIDVRLRELGLRARWAHPDAASFTSDAADRRALERLAQVVVAALARYPAGVFDGWRVHDIALVKDLVVAGQRRRAMPDPAQDALIYADNGGPLCPAGMEARVHHELHHFVDFRQTGDYYQADPQWSGLNKGLIEYGRGGATAYGTGFDNRGHPSPGLVSRYAAYGVEEDKAELFAWSMTPGYAARVETWVKTDAVLHAKQSLMVQRLSAASHGKMDARVFPPRY